DLEEDQEEDPKEDPADYPSDEGDNDDDDDDDDSSDDDDDDDVEEDEEEEEEEEHLAPVDSFVVPTKEPVPSAEDTEAFETNKSAPTPVPSPRPRTARMSVRPQIPMSDTAEALIAEYASAPTPPLPPPSLLSPLSSPLPHIPSPPLPVPSPPLALPPPTVDSPTYAEAPLGYTAAEIQLRAASPPTHPPSIKDTITTPVEESSSVAAARQAGHTLAHTVDYGFIDTLDASICASEIRAITAVGVVNKRVTNLDTTQRQETHEIQVHCEDTQDDRALLEAQVSVLRRERRYFRSMAYSYEREDVIAQQAWSHSKSRIQAMEALIRTL
ncbi:hypothetical protein Tco_0901936, partial [Tanacetum coccineum]